MPALNYQYWSSKFKSYSANLNFQGVGKKQAWNAGQGYFEQNLINLTEYVTYFYSVFSLDLYVLQKIVI